MRKTRKRKKKSKSGLFSSLAAIIAFIYYFLSKPIIFSLTVIFIIGYFLYSHGYYEQFSSFIEEKEAHFSKSSGLVLKDIYLEGQHHTKDKEIIKVMNVKIGQPLVSLNIRKIKQNLEQLPWIKYAVVDRLYPSTLSIKVIERKPMALWQYENKLHLIDFTGTVIEESDLKQFSHLLLIVGEDAKSFTDDLVAILDYDQKIAAQVSSAIRIGQRRWNIRLKNGTEIKLPEHGAENAWKTLINLNKSNNILNSNLQTIDLRIEGKMYTTAKPNS